MDTCDVRFESLSCLVTKFRIFWRRVQIVENSSSSSQLGCFHSRPRVSHFIFSRYATNENILDSFVSYTALVSPILIEEMLSSLILSFLVQPREKFSLISHSTHQIRPKMYHDRIRRIPSVEEALATRSNREVLCCVRSGRK